MGEKDPSPSVAESAPRGASRSSTAGMGGKGGRWKGRYSGWTDRAELPWFIRFRLWWSLPLYVATIYCPRLFPRWFRGWAIGLRSVPASAECLAWATEVFRKYDPQVEGDKSREAPDPNLQAGGER